MRVTFWTNSRPFMLDLDAVHLDTVRSILSAQLPGARVWAFGSRVQGRAKRFSDLDLAVEDEKALDLHQLYALKDAFSESDLPIKVDVLDLKSISPEFRRIVENERVVVI